MHGDFSRWDPVRGRNLGGVLHQQGRVLLDRDWNDQARLAAEWRDTAARDTIGAGVAAVPAHTPTAFQVTRVHVNGTRVEVEVLPGHAWADGIAVTLAGTPGTPVHLTADYLDASVQAAPGSVTGGTAPIAFGVRDVVVLETWRETLSAFQLPAELLEPALGGPDTTARALVAFRLRLARLGTDETCRTVQLADRARGTLRATLPAATPGSGDCPVPDEGGYTGFEHQLYRVEIADVDAGAPAAFKWSRGNGGLVGRGTWVPGTGVPGTGGHFTLAANHVAI